MEPPLVSCCSHFLMYFLDTCLVWEVPFNFFWTSVADHSARKLRVSASVHCCFISLSTLRIVNLDAQLFCSLIDLNNSVTSPWWTGAWLRPSKELVLAKYQSWKPGACALVVEIQRTGSKADSERALQQVWFKMAACSEHSLLMARTSQVRFCQVFWVVFVCLFLGLCVS